MKHKRLETHARPLPEFCGTVVLKGRKKLTVYGCCKILSYTPEKIGFFLPEGNLTVTGRGMVCVSFSAGVVTVEGEFSGVCFDTLSKNGEKGGSTQ